MSDNIIESPALHLQGRGAVAYKGRLMFHSTASRLKEWSPRLRQCAADGMCIAHASNYLGWSVATVARWSKILGVTWRKARQRPVRKYDKAGWEQAIMAGLSAGKTQGMVAAGLGVPLVNVHRYCLDNGINWKHLKSNAKASRQRPMEG